MGHSGDDAVHKITRKRKTHWQHAESVENFGIGLIENSLWIRYKKIDVILVKCPLLQITFACLLYWSQNTRYFYYYCL